MTQQRGCSALYSQARHEASMYCDPLRLCCSHLYKHSCSPVSTQVSVPHKRLLRMKWAALPGCDTGGPAANAAPAASSIRISGARWGGWVIVCLSKGYPRLCSFRACRALLGEGCELDPKGLRPLSDVESDTPHHCILRRIARDIVYSGYVHIYINIDTCMY